MTEFLLGPLLGFDIESTGIDVFEDRIVTFSIVYSESAQTEPIILEWLINPGVEIPEGASEVHGISTEYARENGMEPSTALQEIADRLAVIINREVPLVAFNCTFDITMLLAEFERYSINFPFTPEKAFSRVIDPLVLDKSIDKWRKGSRKLVDMAEHYGYTKFNAHESTADVLATIFIARSLYKKLHSEITLELLQEMQKESKYEQATSLQAYLRNKDNDDTIVINTQWPLQTKENYG